MFTVLTVAIGASLIVMAIAVLNIWPDKNPGPLASQLCLHRCRYLDHFLSGALFLATLILSLLRWWHIRGRLAILEGGMLSIHSCSIVWEAAVLAHFRALGVFPPGPRTAVDTFVGYTAKLGEEAATMLPFAYDLHDWIDVRRGGDASLPERTVQPPEDTRTDKVVNVLVKLCQGAANWWHRRFRRTRGNGPPPGVTTG